MKDCRRIPVPSRVSTGKFLLEFAILALGSLAASVSLAQKSTAPPLAPVRVVTEEYFGTKVADRYRHMENLKDPEVVQWFKEQDAYSRSVLSRIPGHDALLARIRQLDQSGPPRVFDMQRFQNETYFYQKRLPDEDVAKVYEQSGLQGPERLVLEPDKYVTKPAEHYSLDYYVPLLDGRYTAYGVSPSGSEDAVIHVLDLTTGKETGELIDRSWVINLRVQVQANRVSVTSAWLRPMWGNGALPLPGRV